MLVSRTRTRDLKQRALAAQWIAANVLGVSGVRALLDGDAPRTVRVVVVDPCNELCRAILASIDDRCRCSCIRRTAADSHWRAALACASVVPVLEQPID